MKNIIQRIISRIKQYNSKKLIFNQIRERGGEIGTSTKVVFKGEFVFGRYLHINCEGIDNFTRSQIVILPNAKLEIGDNVGMSQVSIICKQSIKIGSNVKIGAGTLIFDTNFHNTDWLVRRDPIEDLQSAKNSPVSIGNDCFIGTRSIICKGISIGDRTIIAAGSVVIDDLPADCIAGGNPCKVIKHIK